MSPLGRQGDIEHSFVSAVPSARAGWEGSFKAYCRARTLSSRRPKQRHSHGSQAILSSQTKDRIVGEPIE